MIKTGSVLLLSGVLALSGGTGDCNPPDPNPPPPGGCESTATCCAGPQGAGMTCPWECKDGMCVETGEDTPSDVSAPAPL